MFENPRPISQLRLSAAAAVFGIAALASLVLSPLPWKLLSAALLLGTGVGIVGLLSRSAFAGGLTVLAFLAFARYSNRLVAEPFAWWQPMLMLLATYLVVLALGSTRRGRTRLPPDSVS
jgi:hypothetical protein